MNETAQSTHQQAPDSPDYSIRAPHACNNDEILKALNSASHGLTSSDAATRLQQYGPNRLPQEEPRHIFRVFLRQFTSPLIYVLLAAGLLSLFIGEHLDASFIFIVLLINAIIGTAQEYSAQRAARALSQLVTTYSRVLRDGDAYEINSEELVPGDIVLLESGDRVPADIRLLSCHGLDMDESLLTGESLSILKDADCILNVDAIPGDRTNMVFASTFVNRGRAKGVVVSTALATEIGRIAVDVLKGETAKAPLIVRMDNFTHLVAIIIGLAALAMAAIVFSRGMPMSEIFMLSVALAVSAIPEGLPVAITVALAVGMHRMANRNVIVRRLVAMEALGSCTFIATDKTGTLTVNQLTARRIVLPDDELWVISGEGINPEGTIMPDSQTPYSDRARLDRLCKTAVLANEAFLGHLNHQWTAHGDAVDIALLVMAHKMGVIRSENIDSCPELDEIPFEPERLFAASLNKVDDLQYAFVKGALEKLLPMCSKMSCGEHDIKLEPHIIEQQVQQLAEQGYRVLALASGAIKLQEDEVFSEEHLKNLTFLGLVGMIDPLRVEANAAINACYGAGIEVAMITGDHPATSFAIAKELSLASDPKHIVTGKQLSLTSNPREFDELTQHAYVFARVEPHQKLDIVKSLQRQNHFVAVSGDGANDAPALRAAHVGVAMGKSGTDLARETADLIIADDNFASIVAGVEEGRIAYANVRKVIFLLISTGAAELVLFALALFTGLPLPLLAVQLLWLNLVTNGIQDIALAFEPAEGDELKRPPRSPKEPIFNRLMVERVVVSAVVIGTLAFVLFQWLLNLGYSIDEARNGTLLLMVLFENIQVFNSRSETQSVFHQNPLDNRLLLFGTIGAQLVHIGAMYTPWLSNVLKIDPIAPQHWLELFSLALILLIIMELHKMIRRKIPKL
ncbi:MAG: HAD-IC family P-type ATPase [Gammaproteobacteria bacterium]|nr:MAG: HAD-IC family P-type ATPase [Gammaproteobacteria bacterium]